jgi:hypothetical protein
MDGVTSTSKFASVGASTVVRSRMLIRRTRHCGPLVFPYVFRTRNFNAAGRLTNPLIWRRERDYSALRASPLRSHPSGVTARSTFPESDQAGSRESARGNADPSGAYARGRPPGVSTTDSP